jgi:hypothetical protein
MNQNKRHIIGFYGHRTWPYGCLSNFYASPFENLATGEKYSCAEQYIMHSKANLFGDAETARHIMLATKPRDMKALGRKVRGFKQDVWDNCIRVVAYDACFLKFSQNANLKSILLATGDSLLAECSPFDGVWGIGMSVSRALQNMDKWGTNILGETLMSVRSALATTN